MSRIADEIRKFLLKPMSKEQCKDTGLAIILILVIIGYFTGSSSYYLFSIPVLLITMTVPILLYPLAILWFGFSTAMGSIISKILLSVIFYLIVVPVAAIRKLMKIDNLKLNEFKRSEESVMIVRDHVYNRNDIEKPY